MQCERSRHRKFFPDLNFIDFFASTGLREPVHYDAILSEEQEPTRVFVQSPDRDPAFLQHKRGQRMIDGFPFPLIFSSDKNPFGFMKKDERGPFQARGDGFPTRYR